MAGSTPRAGLILPTDAEFQDVAAINANSERIDSLLGVLPVTSATLPASPYAGQTVVETDTGAVCFWDSANARWVKIDTRWQNYAPKIFVGATEIPPGVSPASPRLGAAFLRGKYMRVGSRIKVQLGFQLAGDTVYGAASGDVSITYPIPHATNTGTVLAAGGLEQPEGAFRVIAGGNRYSGQVQNIGGAERMTFVTTVGSAPAATSGTFHQAISSTIGLTTTGNSIAAELEYMAAE